MSKARVLADFISDGSTFADGAIDVAEVSGAAPLASPTFTGTVTVPTLTPTTITGGNISGDVRFGTNVNAIFGGGASDYLNIYSDGTNKYIQDTGSGSLFIRGSDLVLEDASGYDYIAMSDTGNGGSVAIKHSGDTKFITSTTGVDITGEVKADKFTNDEALPDVRPSLLLDFANSKTLDPRITFTRGSTGTYWDGKTTTKAEENLQGGSSLFNTTYWLFAQCTFTADYTTAPDGTSTAVRLIEDSSPNYHYLHGQTSNTVSTTSGTTYTWSIYAKKGVGTSAPDIVQLCFRGNTHSTAYANFNISTGAVTGSADVVSSSITSVGNGWYRLVVTATANSSGSGGGGVFSFTNNGPSATRLPIYTGDTNADVLLWGPQFEKRSSATAYTATTTSPIVKYQPVLQTAASGEARFDHDPVTGESKGLLIEESRTNLDPSSNTINWQYNVNQTANAGIAPDGTQTADLCAYTNSGGAAGLFTGGKPSSSGDYTWSVFVKKFGDMNIIRVYDNDAGVYADFNINTGQVDGGNATRKGIYSVGNGWYRVWMSSSVSTNATYFQIYGYDSIGSTSNTINGYDGIFVWGSQLEQGSFPTSYIPTSGSTVTRSAESAYIGVDSWYPYSSGGTVLVEGRVAEVSSDNMFLEGSLSGSGIYDFSVTAAQTKSQFINRYRSVANDYRSPSSTISAGELVRLVGAWSATETNSYLDGSSTTLTANQPFATGANRIYFGSRNGSSLFMNDALKKVAFYPQRLSNATLQAMTEE